MAEPAALDASNRGFRLLQKMGWTQGAGLGKNSQGIVEPVRMKENLVCLGLGKAEEYDAMTEQATRERRKLDAEVVETPEEVQSRLAKAARDDQLKGDVLASHAAFLCRDCQKQYKTVKEMENHLSSYDHHHRKRLQELKKPHVTASEQDAKRKREQQHEAAVLQKRIELAAASAAAAPASAAATPTAAAAAPRPSAGAAKVGFSFGGAKSGAGLSKKPLKKAAMAFNPFGSGS
ncbi:hypothetical protein PybrP1_013145 [[Pythium] brassicae (nom. inval.)]|nr:hypothetical protein PybrP1_013145 [[Pythium] brassicae (nom. inval.)]